MKILGYLCPHCNCTAFFPDPSSPLGMRRVDTTGSLRLRGTVVVACCCRCEREWDWAMVDVTEEEVKL